jgi:hypothetical protein
VDAYSNLSPQTSSAHCGVASPLARGIIHIPDPTLTLLYM